MKTRFLMGFFSVLLLVSLVACGGDKESKKDEKRPVNNQQSVNYPDWFLNPPKASDAIYAIGIANKQNLQLSLDSATNVARAEISRIVNVRVSSMIKDFMEQAGVKNESEYTEFSQSVTKSITDNALSGSQRDKIFIDNSTNPQTVYVLVKLNLADMSGQISEMVKKQQAAYAKLRANKGFEDLAKELKELRALQNLETPKVTAE